MFEQLRLVVYPVLIAGNIVNRYGYFTVTFTFSAKPVEARLPRMVDFTDLEQAEQRVEDTLEAFRMDSLYCLHTVDLDSTEWDGTLQF